MSTLPCGAAVLAGGVVALACAGNTGTAARQRCALQAQDSVYLASGPVYRDCAVDVPARPLGARPAVNYQPTVDRTATRQCYEAEVEFVVDAQGVPETRTARITRATEPRLGEALLASIAQWRFQPAQKDGAAVRMIVLNKHAIGMALGAPGAVGRNPC